MRLIRGMGDWRRRMVQDRERECLVRAWRDCRRRSRRQLEDILLRFDSAQQHHLPPCCLPACLLLLILILLLLIPLPAVHRTADCVCTVCTLSQWLNICTSHVRSAVTKMQLDGVDGNCKKREREPVVYYEAVNQWTSASKGKAVIKKTGHRHTRCLELVDRGKEQQSIWHSLLLQLMGIFGHFRSRHTALCCCSSGRWGGKCLLLLLVVAMITDANDVLTAVGNGGGERR